MSYLDTLAPRRAVARTVLIENPAYSATGDQRRYIVVDEPAPTPRETAMLVSPPCVVCGTPTTATYVPRGRHPLRVCGECLDVAQRREPWWLRALRWLAR